MFVYTKEKQLHEFLIDNFNQYFDFTYSGSEVVIPNGRIDLLGEDQSHIYVIEIKRDEVNEFTISQLSSYLPFVRELYPDKKVIGIATAPKVNKKMKLFELPSNVIIKTLNGVKCDESKITKINGLRNRKVLSNAVDYELYEGIRELSKETQVPISRLLDEAIEDLLEKRKPKS